MVHEYQHLFVAIVVVVVEVYDPVHEEEQDTGDERRDASGDGHPEGPAEERVHVGDRGRRAVVAVREAAEHGHCRRLHDERRKQYEADRPVDGVAGLTALLDSRVDFTEQHQDGADEVQNLRRQVPSERRKLVVLKLVVELPEPLAVAGALCPQAAPRVVLGAVPGAVPRDALEDVGRRGAADRLAVPAAVAVRHEHVTEPVGREEADAAPDEGHEKEERSDDEQDFAASHGQCKYFVPLATASQMFVAAIYRTYLVFHTCR
jgi:hypothetical protein